MACDSVHLFVSSPTEVGSMHGVRYSCRSTQTFKLVVCVMMVARDVDANLGGHVRKARYDGCFFPSDLLCLGFALGLKLQRIDSKAKAEQKQDHPTFRKSPVSKPNQ